MQRHLHILCDSTRQDFVRELIARQQSLPEVETIEITLAEDGTDYPRLLEEVFRADTVTVW